jgi:hypothetical protein
MKDLGFNVEFDEEGYLVVPEGEDHGLRDESIESEVVFEIELPTGHSTYLEVPSLACLLWAGDSKYELCKTIWRHPAHHMDRFAVSDDELDYMYEWGLVEFAKRQRAIGLGAVCKMFACPPSEYIGVKDRMARFLFDSTVAQTLSAEEARQMEEADKPRKRGGRRNLPPDPQEA